MNRIAYCGHPQTYQDFVTFLTGRSRSFRPRGKAVMKKLLEWMPPMSLGSRPLRIHSTTGEHTDMIITTCALIAEQIATLDEDLVVRKIVTAGRLAEKKGARMLGLGGITSTRGRGGRDVARQLSLPVTTGHTLMAATAIKGVERAVARLGGDLASTELVIAGLTEVSTACLAALAPRVRRATLCGGRPAVLEAHTAQARDRHGGDIEWASDVATAVRAADATIWTTGLLTTDPANFKPGAILCDVGLPPWMSERVVKSRPDVLAFLGEVLQPPKDPEWEFFVGHGLPVGTLPTCMVEPALLALGGRYEAYTLEPDPIDLDNVREISQLAERHGFSTDKFLHGSRTYSERDLDQIARLRETRLDTIGDQVA